MFDTSLGDGWNGRLDWDDDGIAGDHEEDKALKQDVLEQSSHEHLRDVRLCFRVVPLRAR